MPTTITAPAAPAAAPAPSQPAAGNTTGHPASNDDLYGVSEEIDALDTASSQAPADKSNAQKPPSKPKEEPEAKKPTDEEEIQALDESEDMPKKAKEDDKEPELEKEQPAAEEEVTPTRAKDLKRVYEETKAVKKQLETKLADAEKRIEELQRTNPDELKAVSDRLAKAEARRDELEQKMRYLDYRESSEFKDKYQTPINEAWQRAILDLNETVVTLEDGSTRKATVDDLVHIGNMPLQDAARVAREMFGDAAHDIMAHRRTIRELTIQQDKALERAQKEAGEKRKIEEVESRQRAEKYQTLWKEESEALATKYPKWMKPVEGDEDGNKLLNSGYQEVDRFFNDNTLAPEDRIKLHAKIRMKAANHDRMALRLRRMAGKIQELKTKLSEFEQSAPPAGKTTPRGGRSGNGLIDDALSEIEALNNPNLD